jgi:SAM-dependent methyltransferase
MPTPLQPALDELGVLLTDPDRLVRAVAAGRRRGTTPPWRRVELRPVALKAGPALQVVRYDERQAHTSNHAFGDAAGAEVATLLAEPFGNWHVETAEETVELRVTKKGEAQVHHGPPPASVVPTPLPDEGSLRSNRPVKGAFVDLAHDRQKQRLLDPSHPFLREVGITDRAGKVKPSRQAKFRQVDDLLRQLVAVLPEPVADRPLRVVDLGCGNAYLTLAAYAYLADVEQRDVRLVGVDVRADSRARNAALAAKLGWSDHVSFVAAPIDEVELDERPDVVLALHACDTATDDALVRAVRWEVPVVLAAPCCHHDLQRRLRTAEPPAGYELVTRHGLLRERFADVLTDALRASALRMLGYRVEVVEFVDSAHTPRNALLRAVRTGARAPAETIDEYCALTQSWGVTPYLGEALAPELALATEGNR